MEAKEILNKERLQKLRFNLWRGLVLATAPRNVFDFNRELLDSLEIDYQAWISIHRSELCLSRSFVFQTGGIVYRTRLGWYHLFANLRIPTNVIPIFHEDYGELFPHREVYYKPSDK